MQRRGIDITEEAYHAVPSGWQAEEIFAWHKIMRGTFPIHEFTATEPGAPAWMTERAAWLRYRATLYRVADGIRAGDPACIEIAIAYILLRHIGSYSGFIRAKLARRLKSAALTDGQKSRLTAHFSALAAAHDYSEEFRDYHKLAKRMGDGLATLIK